MIEWITLNLEALVAILTAVVTAASGLANFTKTDTDNKIVNALGKLVNFLALNWKKN